MLGGDSIQLDGLKMLEQLDTTTGSLFIRTSLVLHKRTRRTGRLLMAVTKDSSRK